MWMQGASPRYFAGGREARRRAILVRRESLLQRRVD
jgi:hypothetical protein